MDKSIDILLYILNLFEIKSICIFLIIFNAKY